MMSKRMFFRVAQSDAIGVAQSERPKCGGCAISGCCLKWCVWCCPKWCGCPFCYHYVSLVIILADNAWNSTCQSSFLTLFKIVQCNPAVAPRQNYGRVAHFWTAMSVDFQYVGVYAILDNHQHHHHHHHHDDDDDGDDEIMMMRSWWWL